MYICRNSNSGRTVDCSWKGRASSMQRRRWPWNLCLFLLSLLFLFARPFLRRVPAGREAPPASWGGGRAPAQDRFGSRAMDGPRGSAVSLEEGEGARSLQVRSYQRLLHSNLSLPFLQSSYCVMGPKSCMLMLPDCQMTHFAKVFVYQRDCLENKSSYERTQIERTRCHRGSTRDSSDDRFSQGSAEVAVFTALV